MKTPSSRIGLLLLLTAAGLAAASEVSVAQRSVGGISFVDRAARNEITLGAFRGSLGVIDYDNDGWYDLFIADNVGLPHRLFRNIPDAAAPGGRSFVDVTASSGIDDADGTARGWGGVVVFDYNNDGWNDIYQLGGGTGLTGGLLYRNNGNGTFTNLSVASGVRQTETNPGSASAVDFDHDGFADLLITNSGYSGKALLLLRNNGDGTFSKRNDLVPATTFGGTTYAQVWTDYDHDGWEDGLILFNNTVPLTLQNVNAGNSQRRLANATIASGFRHVGPAPMGIAPGDFNRDGWIDFAITDAAVGTYYENRQGTLTEVTPFRTFFGWGTTFVDADNDGNLDNYQAGSYSSSNVDFLVRNNGNGTWTDARSALNTTALASQQCARIDIDNDGFEDIITINPGSFVSIYHNQSGTVAGAGHWLKVKLEGGNGVNADAIGTVVRLTSNGQTQVREIVAGSSFSATEDPRAHFGLGQNTQVSSIEIVWPRRGTIAQRTQRFAGPFVLDSIITLSPNAACLPDLNADRIVEDADFVLFASSYNLLVCDDPGQSIDCPADFNADGVVDDQDFSVFAAAYNAFACD
ncbi:MAG: VCBS repeat-containing protein [Phycisphaeraceae bacterium]|nr:VCBS repeat-containing protein [Phycisphaeraceae bacterium]